MVKYLILLLITASTFAQGSIVFDTNFESASELQQSDTTWRSDLPAANPPNANVILNDGNALEGNGYVKMLYTDGGIRSEISRQYIGNANTYFLDWGVEYWLGYAMRVNVPVDGYKIVTQFRPYGDGGSNPFTLDTYNSNTLYFKWSTNSSIKDDVPTTSAGWGGVNYSAPYITGEWTHIVMHFVIHPTNGYVQTWVNGTQYMNHTGTTTYTKKTNGTTKDPRNYIKIGPYYGDYTNQLMDIDYDAFSLWEGAGGTYEDVSPLGLSPGQTVPELPEAQIPVDIIQKRKSLFNAMYN